MAIRITYGGRTVDVLTGPEGLVPRHRHDRAENTAGNGSVETINWYGVVEGAFDAYFTEAVERSMWAWWSWARQGKVWSFALDSGQMTSTTLDGAAAAGQKVVPIVDTTFSAGDECLIAAADDDEFEIVVVDTISAGVSITAVGNLLYTYASGDAFRHRDYYPSVVCTDKDFRPLRSGSYYRATINFREDL